MGLLGTLKYSAPSRENWNPSSAQCICHVCQPPSTRPGIDLPSQVFPLDAAWTVVPGGHEPLPYHSKMSISPSGIGSSLTVQNDGQRPVDKQSSFIRASQVVPIWPRQLPRSLPLK